MSKAHFPDPIREHPVFERPFDACQLNAEGCEVLSASSPADTSIEPHEEHCMRPDVDTSGIEFCSWPE